MAHWKKQGRDVAPRVTILQLLLGTVTPVSHLLPGAPTGSTTDYLPWIKTSPEKAHRKAAVRNEVTCCFPDSLIKRSQMKSRHVWMGAVKAQSLASSETDAGLRRPGAERLRGKSEVVDG